MTNTPRQLRSPLLLATLGALLPVAAAAQLTHPSAADLGLGNTVTATTRGFSAVAANPAGLGMPGTGAFSLAVLPVRVRQGLAPVGLGDLTDWGGRVVPTSVKEAWLRDVSARGGEAGSTDLSLSGLALQVGRVGLQLSTLAVGRGRLAPDAVELLLFGNAGRSGTPGDFDLTGSAMDGYAVSTLGAGFGVPLASGPDGHLALGATVKYSMGHGVLVGRDAGSTLSGDPSVEIEFPVLHTDVDESGIDNGSGLGLDVGLAWERDRLRLGATVRNVVNTFAWDVDGMVFRPGTALFDEEDSSSDFDERPGAEAPGALTAAVEDLGFARVVAVGAAWEARPALTLTADVRNRFGEGMGVESKFRAGLGIEARPSPVVPLRAHVAYITDGYQFGGGLSLVLGPVTLSGAAAAQVQDEDDATVGMFTLSFGGR